MQQTNDKWFILRTRGSKEQPVLPSFTTGVSDYMQNHVKVHIFQTTCVYCKQFLARMWTNWYLTTATPETARNHSGNITKRELILKETSVYLNDIQNQFVLHRKHTVSVSGNFIWSIPCIIFQFPQFSTNKCTQLSFNSVPWIPAIYPRGAPMYRITTLCAILTYSVYNT
jgi:hypothetical protein